MARAACDSHASEDDSLCGAPVRAPSARHATRTERLQAGRRIRGGNDVYEEEMMVENGQYLLLGYTPCVSLSGAVSITRRMNSGSLKLRFCGAPPRSLLGSLLADGQ